MPDQSAEKGAVVIDVYVEAYCCEAGCGDGGCEGCPCCCAGWCIGFADGSPESQELAATSPASDCGR